MPSVSPDTPLLWPLLLLLQIAPGPCDSGRYAIMGPGCGFISYSQVRSALQPHSYLLTQI